MGSQKFRVAGLWLSAVALLLPMHNSWPFEGTVSTVTFTGPITQKSINFDIYLPAGYDTSQARYPVIYYLHGNGGTYQSDYPTVVGALETAIAAGLVTPMIMIFPDGYGYSMWADSYDSSLPAETNVIREEIPYVDGHYRTFASSDARVMMGFSMGGFGCLDYAFKFPDSFCCVAGHSAALDDTWYTANQDHGGIFNADSVYYSLFCPWNNLERNTDAIRQRVAVRLVVGTSDALLPYNRAMRDSLTAMDIPVSYAEVAGVGHDLAGVLAQQGNNDFAFIASHTSTASTAVLRQLSGREISFQSKEGPAMSYAPSQLSLVKTHYFDLQGRMTFSGLESIHQPGFCRDRLHTSSFLPNVYLQEFNTGNLIERQRLIMVQ